MFSNYQVLLILVVSACIGYLVVYGSSSTSIKEGLSKENKCRCPMAHLLLVLLAGRIMQSNA